MGGQDLHKHSIGSARLLSLDRFGWSGFQTTDLMQSTSDILLYLESDSGVASTKKRSVAELLQSRCFQSNPRKCQKQDALCLVIIHSPGPANMTLL